MQEPPRLQEQVRVQDSQIEGDSQISERSREIRKMQSRYAYIMRMCPTK